MIPISRKFITLKYATATSGAILGILLTSCTRLGWPRDVNVTPPVGVLPAVAL